MSIKQNTTMWFRVGVITIGCLAATGCSEQEPDSAPPQTHNTAEQNMTAAVLPDAAPPLATRAAGLEWTAPRDWVQVVSQSPMRAASYDVNGAECVVFHFPNNGGGSVEDNIGRWSSQVLDDAGAATTPSVASFQSGDLLVTTVALRGTYMSGMPMAQKRTPQPDSLFLGAIVENGPEGSIFIRMVGPAEQIETLRESWEMMVRSVHVLDAE
jgi:hypothetical protein